MGEPDQWVRRALAHVAERAGGGPLARDLRVDLHFHPDRLVEGRPILLAMAQDGRYRSQFETGTSNGGLTAHPGGDRWRRFAARLSCRIEWHRGFRLAVEELRAHPDYRGAEIVELGISLARDGFLDARIIGDAARSGDYDQQELKRVWHHIGRFGAPIE